MSESETIVRLEEFGATRERKETSDGQTKSGWWWGTVWLAPLSDPRSALSALAVLNAQAHMVRLS